MLSSKTVESTLQDVASHPGHVADQQLEAMTPLVDGAAGPGARGAGAGAKDLEGVPDTVDAPVENTLPGINTTGGASTSASGLRKRQKKIAVLTSGGDSAGMNAAGEYRALLSHFSRVARPGPGARNWGLWETLV